MLSTAHLAVLALGQLGRACTELPRGEGMPSFPSSPKLLRPLQSFSQPLALCLAHCVYRHGNEWQHRMAVLVGSVTIPDRTDKREPEVQWWPSLLKVRPESEEHGRPLALI